MVCLTGLIEKTKPDRNSFLFTITNPSLHKPTKLPPKRDLHNNLGGIVCSDSTGPYFGTKKYFDLKTLSCTKFSKHIGNYVDLGHGYECPSGLHARMVLFGRGTFELQELEVFKVCLKH